jgi:co-chaperonin GroES (HSP10)
MSRASLFDPLIPIPKAHPSEWKPHYEDRVCVKRLPFPPELDPLERTGLIKPDSMNRTRAKDYQYGEVVRVGVGNSRIHLSCSRGVCEARYLPLFVFRHGRDTFAKYSKICQCGYPWVREISPYPCEVKPGDRIVYNRNPDYEFEADGELFTFLFENQYILGIVEESPAQTVTRSGEETESIVEGKRLL